MTASLRRPHHKQGYTLLEILVAVLILGIMSLMVFGSFHSLMTATQRAEATLDGLHARSALLSRIAVSLRTSVFDGQRPESYEFVHEDGGTGVPRDTISWVTTSSHLLPPGMTTLEGVRRVELSIQDVDGQEGLAVRAFPDSWELDDPEVDDVDYTIIDTRVRGLDVILYDVNEEDWTDEWQRSRQLPVSVVITLYLQGEEDSGRLTPVRQRVDIPVGRTSRQLRRGGGRRVELQ
jgi:type II secretion system protein J